MATPATSIASEPMETSLPAPSLPVDPDPSPCVSVAAWRRLRSRPGLWLGLFLLYQAVTVLSLLPLLLVLHESAGRRPLLTAMARGQADFLWAELLDVDGPVLPSLLAALIFGLVLRWTLQVTLSAGLLSTLLRPGTAGRVDGDGVLRQAVTWLSRSFRLHLATLIGLRLPLLALLIGAGALISRGQRPLTGSASFALLNYAPLVVLGLCAWSALTLMVHVIQLDRLMAERSQPSLFRSIRMGLRRAWASRPTRWQVLGLAALGVLLYGLVIAIGRVLSATLDVRLWVGLALLVRQAAAFARTGLSLWQQAAAAEIWHRLPPPETQTRI